MGGVLETHLLKFERAAEPLFPFLFLWANETIWMQISNFALNSNTTPRPLPPYRGDLKCEVTAREF